MKHLYDIKGLAMNKGKARIWIERRDLSEYGFARGALVDIIQTNGAICVIASPNGKRKVAGRSTSSGDVQILDICVSVGERDALFNGSERLSVYIQHGLIQIESALAVAQVVAA